MSNKNIKHQHFFQFRDIHEGPIVGVMHRDIRWVKKSFTPCDTGAVNQDDPE